MVLVWEANLKQLPSFLTAKRRVVSDHDYRTLATNSDFPLETANRLLGQCKAVGTLRCYSELYQIYMIGQKQRKKY